MYACACTDVEDLKMFEGLEPGELPTSATTVPDLKPEEEAELAKKKRQRRTVGLGKISWSMMWTLFYLGAILFLFALAFQKYFVLFLLVILVSVPVLVLISVTCYFKVLW